MAYKRLTNARLEEKEMAGKRYRNPLYWRSVEEYNDYCNRNALKRKIGEILGWDIREFELSGGFIGRRGRPQWDVHRYDAPSYFVDWYSFNAFYPDDISDLHKVN